MNKTAEEKLKELNPNSKVLLVEQPVLNKGTMGAELWNQVTSEINVSFALLPISNPINNKIVN